MRFPLLSSVIKYVLAISASSATSERVFSNGGRTVTSSRTNLDEDKVEDLVYLSLNLPVHSALNNIDINNSSGDGCTDDAGNEKKEKENRL